MPVLEVFKKKEGAGSSNPRCRQQGPLAQPARKLYLLG